MEGESFVRTVSRRSISPLFRESHQLPVESPSFHKRLLVVDDNEDIHMMLGNRLEAMGYGVLKAGNGLEALNVLAVVPVVGMLLDMEMPVMDGLTLLRELQYRHMHVPVIVMSAGSDSPKLAQAVELGAIDYLRKPIDTVLLAQKCARLFE